METVVNYEYPTTRELREINPEKIQVLERDRPTFDIFPTEESNAWWLEWTVKDNWRGFQQLRGINGEPSYVKMQGWRSFAAEPGVFGEYMTVDERMMTQRASITPGFDRGQPVNIDDLIIERQELLNAREVDLIEYIHWKCLLDGQFTFIGPTGAVFSDVFPIQQAVFSDWSDLVNATPIQDLMGLKTLASGKSVSFGTRAKIYANSVTISYLLRNQNPNDLGGQMAIATGGVKPFKSLADINTVLQGFDLPAIVEYDEGYFAEATGTYTKWIPNDVLSIVGARLNGDRLGAYRKVRNANNAAFAPGSYDIVIDWKNLRVPRLIEVHRGHNGGLVVFYGSAIVRATC